MREITIKWARLSLHCNPLRAIIAGREPKINKRRSGFPARVFPGCLPEYLV
jgi:hypothetical protein